MIKNFLVKNKIKLVKLLNWFNFVKKNYDKNPPIYPKNSDGIKIHLGSGSINLQGWINIDGIKLSHVHNYDENFELKEFSDNSISEIYLCHVLEHFSFEDSEKLLLKLNSKLKKDGIIRLSVPNIDMILDTYKDTNNLNILKNAIMGGQNTKYDFHKSIYNKKELKDLLIRTGFKNISEWNTKEDFGESLNDWSDFGHKINNKSYFLSLNLKGFA